MSPSRSPNQKLIDSNAQNAALPHRFGLPVLRALPIAKPANTAPAKT